MIDPWGAENAGSRRHDRIERELEAGPIVLGIRARMRVLHRPRLLEPMGGLVTIAEGQRNQASVEDVLGSLAAVPRLALRLEGDERVLRLGDPPTLEVA